LRADGSSRIAGSAKIESLALQDTDDLLALSL